MKETKEKMIILCGTIFELPSYTFNKMQKKKKIQFKFTSDSLYIVILDFIES